MYTGDWGDGFITLLFCWTGYHYVMGFVDAVSEARVANAKYTIQHWKRKGFKFEASLKLDTAPLASCQLRDALGYPLMPCSAAKNPRFAGMPAYGLLLN